MIKHYKRRLFMGVTTIVTMTVITVGSAVAQKVLEGAGKTSESQMMDLATKAGIATTALVVFAKFIVSLRSLSK
jgi:hypothetical protein